MDSLTDALTEIEDILSSFGQLGKEVVTVRGNHPFHPGAREIVPKPADEIVYKALRYVRKLKSSRADAIKAEVLAERERCRGWWRWFIGTEMDPDVVDRHQRTGDGIRDGAPAPTADTKGGGK